MSKNHGDNATAAWARTSPAMKDWFEAHRLSCRQKLQAELSRDPLRAARRLQGKALGTYRRKIAP